MRASAGIPESANTAGGAGLSLDKPLSTVTTQQRYAICLVGGGLGWQVL